MTSPSVVPFTPIVQLFPILVPFLILANKPIVVFSPIIVGFSRDASMKAAEIVEPFPTVT